jgi:hypothetical protein
MKQSEESIIWFVGGYVESRTGPDIFCDICKHSMRGYVLVWILSDEIAPSNMNRAERRKVRGNDLAEADDFRLEANAIANQEFALVCLFDAGEEEKSVKMLQHRRPDVEGRACVHLLGKLQKIGTACRISHDGGGS